MVQSEENKISKMSKQTAGDKGGELCSRDRKPVECEPAVQVQTELDAQRGHLAEEVLVSGRVAGNKGSNGDVYVGLGH